MSRDDTIIASVIFERAYVCGSQLLDARGMDERRQISHYGRKMISLNNRGKISPHDTDEQIAASLSAGFVAWLFWKIAPDLLLWIVAAMRKRIWDADKISER